MKRHRTDALSLLSGLVFLGVAVAAWTDSLTWRVLDAERLWPVVLVVAGLALLAGTAREDASRDAGPQDQARDATDGARPGWEPADVDG